MDLHYERVTLIEAKTQLRVEICDHNHSNDNKTSKQLKFITLPYKGFGST
jgi:hypothetical protein